MMGVIIYTSITLLSIILIAKKLRRGYMKQVVSVKKALPSGIIYDVNSILKTANAQKHLNAQVRYVKKY